MKHKLLLCGIGVFLFFSCKKEKHTPDTKLYPISFKLSDFALTQVPIGLGKTKTASLATQATDTIPVQRLVYWLFATKDNNLLISSRAANKGNAGFGIFTDNVKPGEYLAVFAGGSANFKNTNGAEDYSNFSFTYSTVPGTSYWEDTFFKRVPITVTSSGINMNVALNRITARLDLVIKDAIPTGTSKIVVSFPDTAFVTVKTGLRSTSPVINGANKTINAVDIGKTNYTIIMYTLNNIKPFDVIVSYYSANPNGPIGTKTIKNVVCKVNTVTTLSGNLFVQGNNEFNITVNQDWNTATVDF